MEEKLFASDTTCLSFSLFFRLQTLQRPPDAEEALNRNWRERTRNNQNDDEHIQTKFLSSAKKLAEKRSEKKREKIKEKNCAL